MAALSTRDTILFIVILMAFLGAAGWYASTLGARVRAFEKVRVRCREGHVFLTRWIPGVSLNAIRLGAVRYQYCPVGRHWTFITPI